MLAQAVESGPAEWMTFTVAVLAGLAVYTIIMFLQHARAAIAGPGDDAKKSGRNGVVTILLAFLGGIAIVWWFCSAEITKSWELITGAGPLTDLDTGSRLLLALGFASLSAAFAQFVKSRDNSDSATTPKILP